MTRVKRYENIYGNLPNLISVFLKDVLDDMKLDIDKVDATVNLDNKQCDIIDQHDNVFIVRWTHNNLGKEIEITYNVWYEEPLDEKLIT
jgi:hypothetical protein